MNAVLPKQIFLLCVHAPPMIRPELFWHALTFAQDPKPIMLVLLAHDAFLEHAVGPIVPLLPLQALIPLQPLLPTSPLLLKQASAPRQEFGDILPELLRQARGFAQELNSIMPELPAQASSALHDFRAMKAPLTRFWQAFEPLQELSQTVTGPVKPLQALVPTQQFLVLQKAMIVARSPVAQVSLCSDRSS